MNSPAARLPIFDFADGRRFIPSYREPSVATPFTDWSEDQIREYVISRWRDAFEAKRGETARLGTNVEFYDGHHYSDPWQNNELPVENRIYEMVETLVANAIISKPRPEPQPLRTMNAQEVQGIAKFSEWYMDQSEWDRAREMSMRDRKLYGWCIRIITVDHETGFPFPMSFPVWDYYPDPSGDHDNDRSYWFLAGPKATSRLCAMYPHCADEIVSDNIASPKYQYIDRHWYDFVLNAREYDHPAMADSALLVHPEGETPTETTTLASTDGERRDHGATTFTLQMIVRDDGLCDATYYGRWVHPDGREEDGAKFTAKNYAPRSESGYWLITMISTGKLLHRPVPLDDCFLGLPWVVEMEEERTDAAYSRSPVDHAIPVQRELDDSNYHLDQNLERAANPPLKTSDQKLEQQLQSSPVRGGDVLYVQKSSIADTQYLDFPSPAAQHFARGQELRASMRDIGGFQGALEGSKTPGVEAAAAFRHLDMAASRRLASKQGSATRADALLLRKLIYCAGKKLQPEIAFQSTDGQPYVIQSDALVNAFRIRFAEGSATVEGRTEREEKVFALFEMGILDEMAVLQELNWPDAEAIALRMQQRKMEEQLALAAVSAANGPAPGGNGGGAKSRSRSGARR